ncbi:uncharacterized protein LOC120688995 [Panicum virgatum]|uniref:uncharacterized protein LOC120688995 n=1 Tax=Panicum virgatum TaxID=38727 RepID=UPI0019D5A5C6|nr:uncharacterized protein LOC120688995 [Panicum virgatum]
MDAYCREIRELEAKFYGLEFHHDPRDDNVAADVLSKLGSKRSIVPSGVFVQALNSPTVKLEEEPPTKLDLVPTIGQQVLTLDTDWRSPIIDFIKNNKIYPKGKEHEKLARRSSNYVVIGTELFSHIFVVIDKFTKWIEVKPVTATTAAMAAEFIEEISHRFGVPNRIITNLGTSFTGSEFWYYCQKNCIDVYYVSVAHPRCNGQVERANGLILLGLKARIFDPIEKYGAKWLQELPGVVRGLRTQKSRATGYSPFFMVYSSKAVLPSDIAFGAPRIQNYDDVTPGL